jgi:predicted amidophosphoribosyltransferase
LLLQRHDAFHSFFQECLTCQQEIAPHAQVCAHCGTRLATSCPGCGTPLPPVGAPACPRCGIAIPQVTH